MYIATVLTKKMENSVDIAVLSDHCTGSHFMQSQYLFNFLVVVLPMFVNADIRKEMYKGADANVDAQFKKLYIYHMENVSILFADIKVTKNPGT